MSKPDYESSWRLTRVLLENASLAFRQALSKQFRAIFWRSLGLTLLLLFAVWIGL